MLNREIALERLRTVGSLNSDPRLSITIAVEAARGPLPHAVSKLMLANARVSGPRHLAPSNSQAVLP